MTFLETRKAQLREYIEARAKATQGEWKVDSEHGQDVFANGEGRVLSSDPRWNYAPGKISCYNNLKFAALAANESAKIAEQLLECIERWEKVADYSTCEELHPGCKKYKSYEDGWHGVSEYAKQTLKKIAGEK